MEVSERKWEMENVPRFEMDFVLDLAMYLADFAALTDSQSSKCYAKFLEG